MWKKKDLAGTVYSGPAAWVNDPAVAPHTGYYALTEDGKTVLSDVPLVCVDDAPGDPNDGACHYEYAGPKDYPQRAGTNGVVELEAAFTGSTEVSA